ncbi:unnamed protein product [Vicia faba]|uniref:Transmembrane protein n=1 Tax=Vicia faba TaxID=3906 RepID=A0AAV0YKC2_VICFA|nr:unnamed protein product [Vicia faba]
MKFEEDSGEWWISVLSRILYLWEFGGRGWDEFEHFWLTVLWLFDTIFFPYFCARLQQVGKQHLDWDWFMEQGLRNNNRVLDSRIWTGTSSIPRLFWWFVDRFVLCRFWLVVAGYFGTGYGTDFGLVCGAL